VHKKKSNKCCIFHKDEISDSSDEEEAEEDGAKGKKKHRHEDEDHQISAVKRPDQEPTSTGLAASDISTS
jgi:hypothetical protein